VVQASDPAPAEVLEMDGGPRLSARSRWVLVVAVAVLCVVGVAAWRVDARSRDRDERAVTACHDAALRADLRASDLVGYMVHEVDPVIYKVPEGPRRDGIVALVAGAAGRALPTVRKALAQCRATEVAWPHRTLVHQRDSYIDYLTARVRRLEEVAANGHSYYHDQPELGALRNRAFGT
jgi:hypothetical protein